MWSGGGEKKKAYSRVPTQALVGEMFYLDDISPKRGKHELKSLDACYRS